MGFFLVYMIISTWQWIYPYLYPQNFTYKWEVRSSSRDSLARSLSLYRSCTYSLVLARLFRASLYCC